MMSNEARGFSPDQPAATSSASTLGVSFRPRANPRAKAELLWAASPPGSVGIARVSGYTSAAPARASRGETARGMKYLPPRAPHASSPGANVRPAPSSPPMSAWVVEMGMPKRVAVSTVPAPARPTATRKRGSPTTSGGTSPLPENAFKSAPASTTDASEPATCAAVARVSAPRYSIVREP